MIHARRWAAPPTRREFTLVLFSLTIFVLSYNLEASLGAVGATRRYTSAYLSTIGLSIRDTGFDRDGRRPQRWRDELEDKIFGDWEWKKGQVSGNGRSSLKGVGRHAAIYNFDHNSRFRRHEEDSGIGISTGVTVGDQFVSLSDGVPQTNASAHAPGFTILNNVIVVNGTFFLVTDDHTTLPRLGSIASSFTSPTRPPRGRDWQIVTTAAAASRFGPHAGKIHGTTWLVLGEAEQQDPYTLFSLFRTYASLSSDPVSLISNDSASANATITPRVPPAPLRIIYPHVPTFSSPHVPPSSDPNDKTHPPPRTRSYNGAHPLLPKAILPTVGIWYAEDWDDLADMHIPWLLERVVIADRGAAERGRADWTARSPSHTGTSLGKRQDPSPAGEPSWAAAFAGLDAPDAWWASARAALLRYLRVSDRAVSPAEAPKFAFWGGSKKKRSKPDVSYISMQEEPVGAGPRLHHGDHAALVEGLRRLQREGVLGAVHVLKGNGTVPPLEWEARMRAIATSSIVLGPCGFQLADSIFMRSLHMPQDATPSSLSFGVATKAVPPVPAPLLMEFFPPGRFTRDQQYAMQVLGIDYMAWWNDRIFTGASLPEVSPPSSDSDELIALDVDAVLHAVKQQAPARAA